MKLFLSGGGFRATLFHLGVIRYLRYSKDLGKVRQISSVSGGSILAAKLILDWDSFTSDSPEVYSKAETELLSFVSDDLRGRVWWRWVRAIYWVSLTVAGCLLYLWCYALPLLFLPQLLLPVRGLLLFVLLVLSGVIIRFGVRRIRFRLRSLTEYLREEYDTFFGIKSSTKRTDPRHLRHLAGDKRPQLRILATDLTTGEVVAFDSKGVLYARGDEAPQSVKHDVTIGTAVACSSAFPAVFPPLKIDHSETLLGQTSEIHIRYLADGGVYDNLGIVSSATFIDPKASDQDLLVISDAERAFSIKENPTFPDVITRSVRVSDIMMKRLSEFATHGRNLKHIKLRDELDVSTLVGTPKDTLPTTLQQKVRLTRTDLNKFRGKEVQCLVAMGFLAAKKQLNDTVDKNLSLDSNSEGVPTGGTDAILALAADDFKDEKSLEQPDNLFHLASPRHCFQLLWWPTLVALVIFSIPFLLLWLAPGLDGAIRSAISSPFVVKATSESVTPRVRKLEELVAQVANDAATGGLPSLQTNLIGSGANVVTITGMTLSEDVALGPDDPLPFVVNDTPAVAISNAGSAKLKPIIEFAFYGSEKPKILRHGDRLRITGTISTIRCPGLDQLLSKARTSTDADEVTNGIVNRTQIYIVLTGCRIERISD